jgi:hypothetical protein
MRALFTVVILFFLNLGLFSQVNYLLNEGFESWPANGWTSYTLGAGSGWIQSWQNSNEAARHGNHSAYPSISNSNCNNWLVSPAMDIKSTDYKLSFWERFDNMEYYENSAIHISTGSANPTDGDYILLFSNSDTSTLWLNREFDLAAYAGDTVFIAFQYTGTWHTWFVDDVIVGPDNFSDAMLSEITNPKGASTIPGTELVKVNLINKGIAELNQLNINWSVNGVPQNPYQSDQLGLASFEEVVIELGNYNFSSSGVYEIIAIVEVADDANPINDTIRSVYAITNLLDGRLIQVQPEAFSPNTGWQDVRIVLQNLGGNKIDSTLINWSVNGASQPAFSATNLNLIPGETTRITIGQFDFQKGVHTINATAEIIGDTSIYDNSYQSYAAIDTFWESFEGLIFPPNNWSFNFAVKDNINFGIPPHGNYYYSAMSDDNFFGVVTDTLFTPYLNIEAGDIFNFRMNNNPFLATTNTVIAKNIQTGELTSLGTINTLDNEWDIVNIDLTPTTGVYSIGIITSSVSAGFSKIDLISSSASVYLPDHDLAIEEPDISFLARKNITQDYSCVVKNYGKTGITGNDYNILLMDTEMGVLASVPGQDVSQWEEVEITIPYVFDELGRHSLYLEIDYLLDENITNNRSRQTKIQVVPENTVLKPIGSPDYINLNLPFNSNGSTQSLGEDDLNQTMYYPDEIDGQGNLYGIIYKYDNLLSADYVQNIPFKVWMVQTDIPDLEGGWHPAQELSLIFDDTIQILPGFDHELYIPFDAPIPYSGLNNLIIQDYAYNPQWPPSIMRIYTAKMPNATLVRAIGQLDVYDLDPLNPEPWFNSFQDIAFTTFVLEPILDTGLISGYVFGPDSIPIAGATVSVSDIGINVETDLNGSYNLPYLPLGDYSLTASASSYNDQIKMVALDTASYQLNFYLEKRPQIEIRGIVEAAHTAGILLENVGIIANGYSTDTALTTSSGEFILQNIFGTSHYELTFSLYGYQDTTITVLAIEDDIDIGIIRMTQELFSPFDIHALVENKQTEIRWKDPLQSEMMLLQNDMDVCSFSYTNEPNERVWLGNLIRISDTTTITDIEIRTDIYDLSDGMVRIEVFNEDQELIASSESFVIQNDTVLVIDIPNIVVYRDVFATIRWGNNPESTHAFCLDFSDDMIPNTAVIRYPGEPFILLSEFLGGGTPPLSFHIRAHTVDSGNPVVFQENKAYNIYRGQADEFPNTDNWQLINSAPTSNLWYTDNTWTPTDETGQYRYAVETVYTSGTSEETFSNEISWEQISSTTDHMFKGQFNLFPNPATNHFTINLELETEAKLDLWIYDLHGRLIEQKDLGKNKSFNQSRMVSDLLNGTYLLKIRIDDEVLIHPFEVIKE